MMLADGTQIPTRVELLSTVKRHSKLLGQTTVDEGEPSDLELDSHFWNELLDMYFVRGRESQGRHDDDLLFFVRKMVLRYVDGFHGYGFSDKVEDDSPYFVRRWAPKLDDLIGGSIMEVDWRCSFYLNLIAHTSFSITVAICSHRALQNYQNGQGRPLSPVYKVIKTVYASPSRINFHLDSRKEVETTAAYPAICFAVDDFDLTIDAVVLTDLDHCYCVLLNAYGGAAFPSYKAAQESSSTNGSSPKSDTTPAKIKGSKITLLSGFVTYQMVRDMYDAGRSGFGSLLSLGHSPGKTDKIYLKGPGGLGEVEVAVSGVADQSKHELNNHPRNEEVRFATIVKRASMAAKHAYAVASSGQSSDELYHLKCCLMSVSLPWEYIAHNLLFKVKS